MSARTRRRLLARGALLSPLVLFLFFFFFVPLFNVMRSAIYDPVIARAFPVLSRSVEGWDRAGPPTPDMQEALIADLRGTTPEVLGDAVRRLNGMSSGFRSLMSKTTRALEAAPDPATRVDLLAVDARWGDPLRWQAIVDNLSPYTDRFLLAAFDLERDSTGAIAAMPPERAANFAYFTRTFVISALVTGLCILIGLPYAMLAASVRGRQRQLLLAAVLIPMWTSILVRASSWFILMQDQGLINGALIGSGLSEAAVPLLFTRTGVVLSMTHMLLPFMVLPVFNVLVAIPGNLMPAAAALGANPLRAFWHVLLPLAARGIVSGSLLVFMTSIGFYILPAILGGPAEQLISSLIAMYSTKAANWPMASALGLILFGITSMLYVVFGRIGTTPARRN